VPSTLFIVATALFIPLNLLRGTIFRLRCGLSLRLGLTSGQPQDLLPHVGGNHPLGALGTGGCTVAVGWASAVILRKTDPIRTFNTALPGSRVAPRFPTLLAGLLPALADPLQDDHRDDDQPEKESLVHGLGLRLGRR